MSNKYEKINYLLGTYYHQDVWDEHSTHQDVWQTFIKDESEELVKQLKREVQELLEMSSLDGIYKVILDKNPDGLLFKDSGDAKRWLEDLNHFLSKI